MTDHAESVRRMMIEFDRLPDYRDDTLRGFFRNSIDMAFKEGYETGYSDRVDGDIRRRSAAHPTKVSDHD